MKVILLTIGFFMVVQGNEVYGVPSKKFEDNIAALAKHMVIRLNDLQEEGKKIIQQTKSIGASLFELRTQVFKVLTENPSIKAIEDTLKDAATAGKSVEECQKLLENNIYWLGEYLEHHLTDDVERNLKTIELGFLIMNSELDHITKVLTNHLDREIRYCKESRTDCRITGEFEEKTNQLTKLVSIVSDQLPKLIESGLHYFRNIVIPDEANTKIGPQINQCLKK